MRRGNGNGARGVIVHDAYTLGNRTPRRLEEPADAQRVASTLSAAAQAGEAVVAFGGSTLQTIGNMPARYTVALSLRRLDRVVEYDPRNLTIGLDAGMTLGQVTATLAANRQFIPFDAPLAQRATIGGTLAAGWAGPRRASYGHLRDLLIGSTVSLTDGSLAAAGGMVVKNVTGYDMSKVYVGSLGTLGVIVRANFKALPRPAAQRLAVAPLANELVERTLAALAQLTIEPTAALVVDGFLARVARVGDEAVRLFVLFEGSAAVIDRATRELRSILGRCGVAQTLLLDAGGAGDELQNIIDAYIEPVGDRSITWRAAGRPSDVWPRATAARRIASEHGFPSDVIADLRTGDAIVRIAGANAMALAESLPALAAALRDTLPAATVLAGDAKLRARIDAWGSAPTAMATLRAIKTRFDPNGTLAPGRYVGGL